MNNRIKKEVEDINREIKDKIAGYIVAAFGLVAGLAWNDAIRSFIEYYFPLKENSILAKFIYAGVITILVALVSFYVIKFLRSDAPDKTTKKTKK